MCDRGAYVYVARQGARRRPEVTLKRSKASDKLIETIGRLEEKIKAFKSQIIDREAEKKVTLSTIYCRSTISILGAWPCRAISVLARTYSYSIGSSFPSSHIGSLLRCKKHDVADREELFEDEDTVDEMCVNIFNTVHPDNCPLS